MFQYQIYKMVCINWVLVVFFKEIFQSKVGRVNIYGRVDFFQCRWMEGYFEEWKTGLHIGWKIFMHQTFGKWGGLQIWFRKGVAAPGAFQIHTTCSIEGPRLNAHIRGGHVTISEGHTQTAIGVAWTQLHYFPYIKIHYASILKEKTACNCGVFPHGCRLA